MVQTTSPKDLLLTFLGLRVEGLLQAVVKPTLLTASLFAGPLVQLLLTGRTQQEAASTLQSLRNLLIAPVTEEFCFRACMSPLFLLQVCSLELSLLPRLLFIQLHKQILSDSSTLKQ